MHTFIHEYNVRACELELREVEDLQKKDALELLLKREREFLQQAGQTTELSTPHLCKGLSEKLG